MLQKGKKKNPGKFEYREIQNLYVDLSIPCP